MTGIRLENISKTFGPTTVIKGLDLTIENGEFFTFVGPSGCGKSTVLNLIAGLEQLSGGSILFDGTPVNRLSPKERDVAMVFQSYALYPHMTVYDNIAFPLRMKKEKNDAIDREVNRVAKLLGLADFLKKRPKELSGGQRQRVALGRAIIRKPKVFLMDEPLSNLDARLRIEMRAELKRLHQELGITTVYVTHDQGEAMGLSDRIAVLNNGDIQQCDTPREVYRNPANTFVGGFIGSPPMNFIRCIIRNARPPEVDCLGMIFRPNVQRTPAGGEVILGIRPEDVRLTTERPEQGLEVTVSIVEPAGSFTWVVALCGESSVMGIAPIEEGLQPGAQAHMTLPGEKSLIFDPSTGERIGAGAAPANKHFHGG
jgi:multiple sugar transport system ATP-binding protein